MYPHQAERLTAMLERESLAALVATTPANVAYVTGFQSFLQATYRGIEVLAVFTPRGTALVVPAGEVPAAGAAGVEVARVHAYGREPSATPGDALAAALQALGVTQGRVGLDEHGLDAVAWRRIVESLGGLRVVEAAAAFAAARSIKSPWEIECLQRALHIAEESVNAVIQTLQPEVNEREASRAYQAEVARRGANPYGVMLLFGERAAFPFIDPSERALKAGDLVRFDLGCVYKGYYGHLGRTAVMGEPNARQQQLADALQSGLEAAIEAVRPGVAAGQVFAAAIEATRKAGLTPYERGHVGHAIGLEPYEPPKLAPGDEARLEAGMVLRVETPYYEPGWGGLQMQDTVLVTRGGAAVMNRSARGLVMLD